MTLLDKLTFDGECFMWDGDQIAFVESPGVLCLCMEDEDFENGEIPAEKAEEILNNKQEILEEMKRRGYSFS